MRNVRNRILLMAVECDASHKKRETYDDDDDTIDLCFEESDRQILDIQPRDGAILTTLDTDFDMTTPERIQQTHLYVDPEQDEQQQTQQPRRGHGAQSNRQEDARPRQEAGLILRSAEGKRIQHENLQKVNASERGCEDQQEPQQQ